MPTDSQYSAAYVVLIGGDGPVQSRITGSIPRVISRHDLARLRSTLLLGNKIEVRCTSVEAWEAMRGNLLEQIGVV